MRSLSLALFLVFPSVFAAAQEEPPGEGVTVVVPAVPEEPAANAPPEESADGAERVREAAPEDEAGPAPVAQAEDEERPEEEPLEEGDLTLYGRVQGSYDIRVRALSDLPLMPLERSRIPPRLGQTLWGEQWLRMRAELGLDEAVVADTVAGTRGEVPERSPKLRLIGEIDLLDGVLFGDRTVGVDAADRPRGGITAFENDGVEPRALYAEWRSPVGQLRAGLLPSHWGLGILANDGDHPPPFGDARRGDRVIRAAFATRPFGKTHPFVLALASDLVYDDVLAQLPDGDRALQAIVAAFYQRETRVAGVYLVYRNQESPIDDPVGPGRDGSLRVFGVDGYFNWEWDDGTGGRVFAALEAAYLRGETTLAPTVYRRRHDVEQLLVATQLGRRTERTDLVLEAGYASGDSAPDDGVERRATFDPEHRVGLILFPEVLAWQSARSATLAQSRELFGRPAAGSELLPTQGGVAGAMYFFPHFAVRPTDFLELRLGGVWALASADMVDPFRLRTDSVYANHLGGDSRARDLGFEVDSAIRFHGEAKNGMNLAAGVEGGVFVPGSAFDDAEGRQMDTLGTVSIRGGMTF